MNFLQQYIINPIRDFIYPPVCFTCNQHLRDHEVRVCSVCWNSFTCIDPSHPTWNEIKGKFAIEKVVQDIFSCFLFEKDGKLQDVIHLLKYQGMKSLGIKLGDEIGRKITAEPEFVGADYLIPIPLHKLKKRERGFNQSEYICKGISAITNIPTHIDIIVRKKYTQSQTQLNLQERNENVGDAFEVNPRYQHLIPGKSFILVDDVITTGSTINACAKELTAHRADRIIAASIALAE